MVEDDGVEVTTVVVGDEVFSGVGALQAAGSDTLVLQQCLIQGKQHLQGERDRETASVVLILQLHTQIPLLCVVEEFAMKK